MDEGKLEALIGAATKSCYDDEEAFWGVFCALQINLSFPLQASVGGEGALLLGLDEPGTDPQGGVMAKVEKGGREESVALAEVELASPDPASAQWLAAYRYWLSK